MHVNCLDRIKQLEQALEDKESELKAKNDEISELGKDLHVGSVDVCVVCSVVVVVGVV